LPESAFEVGFACVKPDRFPALRRCQQSPLALTPMRSRFDVSPARALARQIKAEGYALVHTHTPRAALVGRVAAALAGVPMVHHLHSPTNRDTTHPLRNRFNTLVERCCLRRVSALIAVSESLGRWAQEQGHPPSRVWVVPNGVPCQGPLAERRPPVGVWTLGTVALFRPRKGLEVLLDAVSALRCGGLPVRLRAVGGFETPEYEQEMRSRAERLGMRDVVEWPGFRQDISSELLRMDLLVLPSLFGEGLPMVVLEAMAAGTPILATRVEGVPEAVRDGREGLLVEPGNPSALAQAASRVIRGQVDWHALRAAAHRRQAEFFSDRSMAEGVARVYRQVLGNGD
jgi:glycosyltransferase involved in cell wall biosynthesis